METPPHVLLHFGMTGWIFVKGHYTGYQPAKGDAIWPPRYVKFILKVGGKGDHEEGEYAFVDARRFARIRLIYHEDPLQVAPLKDSGFDPVLGMISLADFNDRLLARKVPIKALLLDQGFSAGVGNWVADEVLFQARLHPEQYSNTFSKGQVSTLYDSLVYVCKTAVDLLGDSSKFPDHWIMLHRWSKAKKESSRLPNGQTIKFLTVGGRTSAVVPEVQKKTAEAADDAENSGQHSSDRKPSNGKPASVKRGGGRSAYEEGVAKKQRRPSKSAEAPKQKVRQTKSKGTTMKNHGSDVTIESEKTPNTSRRSSRLMKAKS